MFQFPSNGKARVNPAETAVQVRLLYKFQFPSNGKARVNSVEDSSDRTLHKCVSIPFKREGTCEQPLFCTQSGPGSVHPKTKRELREAFFAKKFGANIRQTLVNTDPNAIFQHKQLGSQTPSAFLGNFRRIRTQSTNRVCVYTIYPQFAQMSNFFIIFYQKMDETGDNRERYCFFTQFA